MMALLSLCINQRTNGPVNAHLISWPSKAQNIQIIMKSIDPLRGKKIFIRKKLGQTWKNIW